MISGGSISIMVPTGSSPSPSNPSPGDLPNSQSPPARPGRRSRRSSDSRPRLSESPTRRQQHMSISLPRITGELGGDDESAGLTSRSAPRSPMPPAVSAHVSEGSLPGVPQAHSGHAAHAGMGTDSGSAGGHGHGHGDKKLGMFHGVLIPTCENMWGVIIFLRFYTIVGNAGLGLSVVIVTLSFVAALVTALSLSAIATCGTSVGLQGVYPMLSRALGKEIATAIGFVYFLGIVFLAVLECLGACEELFAVNRSLGEFPLAVQLWGSVFMFSLTLLVGGGIKMVSHLGILFFVIVIVTLFLFYVGLFGAPNLHAFDAEAVHHSDHFHLGLSGEHMAENFGPDYSPGTSFATSLAVFFPCFTGILSGANRASSLEDPTYAIPYGTLGAITLSYVMYMSYMLLWAAVGPREFLLLDHGQLDLLLWPSVKLAQIGIVLSSLGQALQCLVVAPRLLSSIAQDQVLRLLNPLAVKAAGEPKRALIFAYVVGGLCVLIGSLDLVAPLLSMCFLLCYSFMNLNCFVLDVLKDPHWRPKWQYFHWSVGLFGFLLCTGLMFAINYIYALVAWVLAGIILFYILRNNAETDWGSALHGLRFQLAVRSLLAIDMESHLDQSWKPQLLLLYTLADEEGGEGGSDRPDEEASGHTHKVMFSIADQLRHGSGLTIACAIIPLLPSEAEDDPEVVHWAKAEKVNMEGLMKDMGVEGFSMTVLSKGPTDGKQYAIQCAGLGPLTPNTVVMGWPWWWKRDPKGTVPSFISAVHQCTMQNKAILLGHNVKDFPTNEDLPVQGYIDVWWIKHDGGLLLLISHLLKKHRVWRRCLLRLHLITDSGSDPTLIKERIHKLLNIVNISAHVEDVILVDSNSLLPYMQNHMRKQDKAAPTDLETVDELMDNPLPLEDEDEKLRAAVGLGKQRLSMPSRGGAFPPEISLSREVSTNRPEKQNSGMANGPRKSLGPSIDTILYKRDTGDRKEVASTNHSFQGGSSGKEPTKQPPSVPKPRVCQESTSVSTQAAARQPGPPAPPSVPPPVHLKVTNPPPSPPSASPPLTPGVSAHHSNTSEEVGQRKSEDSQDAPTRLERFISSVGLDEQKVNELNEIIERSVAEATQRVPPYTSYTWDKMHEIIQAHSQHSELVIINLPDPPYVERVDGEYAAEDFASIIDYMEYMEGLAQNLPRVLFVHGAGQEVIKFGG